jgi:ATP-dependent helicase HepA
MSDAKELEPGTLVRLKSQPDARGAVIAVNKSGPEIQYTVLLDGKTRTFFASQLVADAEVTEKTRRLSAKKCRAVLTAHYINRLEARLPQRSKILTS